MLLIKLLTVISSVVGCSSELISVVPSWSQSSKQLGVWLARGPPVLSSPCLTSSRGLGLTPLALSANVPGSSERSVDLLFILHPIYYLTIILCFVLFCFFFCLALKKNNITKFPNVHSRVRISSSTPVVEDTQSWQASLFT